MDKDFAGDASRSTASAMEQASGRDAADGAQASDVGQADVGQAGSEAATSAVSVSVGRQIGRPRGRKTGKKIRRAQAQAKILEYRALGLPVGDIAKVADLSVSRVKQILKQFEPTFAKLKEIEGYRDVRQELLTATELQLLESVNDPEKLAAATLRDSAYAFDVLYKTGRLERGQSTSNNAVQQIAVRSSAPDFTD